MSGEAEPPAIAFLRWLLAYKAADGEQFSPSFRRESAAAIAFWERKCRRAELQYSVADQDEIRASWRRIINGLLRRHLWAHNRWPRDKHVLYTEGELFELPPHDPELALSALLMPNIASNAAVAAPSTSRPCSTSRPRSSAARPCATY